jgi:hypothetical protein
MKTTSGAAANTPLMQDWRDITLLSERMLEAARGGNWSALFDMESRRTALIARAMPDPQGQPEAAMVELRKVLALNGQLLQVLQQQQASCGAELEKFGHGRRALEHYGKHQQ